MTGNPYRELFAQPGAFGFSAAGVVMRMPISMVGLGIVLLVAGATGSYALAGGVSATFALAQASVQPLVGRLVDRVGQTAVTLPALAVHAAGILGLVLAATTEAPAWTLFLAAAVGGTAFVPVGALVRARWAHVVGGGALLGTAYSLESVLDELIFIVGPVVVTLLATNVARAAGLLAALAFLTAGTVALAFQRRTEPPVQPLDRHTPRERALRVPAIRVLALTFVAVGAVFGSVEVSVVAFADERGVPAAAAAVLAAFAAGSMLSGLAYGAIRWRSSVRRRYLVAVIALGLAVGLLPLATRVPFLGLTTFAAGFAISPTLIGAYGIAEALLPIRIRTEGFAWLHTGIGVGLATGSSLAGQAIDRGGARLGLTVTLAAGLCAVAVAVAGRARLGR